MGAKAASLAGLLPEALPEPPKDADAIIDEEDMSPRVSSASGISWSLATDGYGAPDNDTTEHWCLAVQENTYSGGKILADPGRAFSGTCEKMSNQ